MDVVPTLTPLSASLLLAAGIAAGWLNTLAGGGSMLTVPLLMWFGLSADLANGTSRLGVLTQGVTAARGFRKFDKLEGNLLRKLAPPCVLGAFAGAYAATLIPNTIFKPLLAGTLMLMAFTLLFSPSTFNEDPSIKPFDENTPLGRSALWLFLAGFYGGLMQAGVGLILLWTFAAAFRIDLVRGNALKVFIVFLFSIVVVPVFAMRGRIEWLSGGVLAFGQIIGAQLGVRFAITRGQGAIRKVVFVMVVVMAASLFFK